jgi:hypothetical protein
VFDDTVYFLGFKDYNEAKKVYDFLRNEDTQLFLSSLIFWEDKRPIKTGILNQLKLTSQSSTLEQQQMF